MALNPPGQYANDRKLTARQRLWRCQQPAFDLVAWVLELAGLAPGMRVLDIGCGNGAYLRGLRDRQVRAAGCDLSMGMLRAASHRALFNADAAALPVRDGAVDAVIAANTLDLVPDRARALREVRRVLVPGGVCVAVTVPGTMSPRTYAGTCRRSSAAREPSSRRVTLPPSCAASIWGRGPAWWWFTRLECAGR